MPYRCLSDFLEELGHAGQLTRVEEEVDPATEVAEIAARTAKTGGPALLFGSVKGHHLPVLANLLATEDRIRRALGVDSLDDLSGRIARLLDASSPEGWFERLKGGAQPAGLASVMPRKVKAAACQQIVRLGSDINLGELPLLTSATISSAAVFSAEPDSHQPIAGRFDLQRIDRTRLAICWATHDDHARLLGEYRLREQKMPVAVVIGGDPAFLLASAAPLPPGGDVCAVAGLLREKALDVVTCRGLDLDVPAEAEIILEGFVDPAEPMLMAGPLCAPLGHATLPRLAPVLHVTAFTHRANPIYAVMVPGCPPNEPCTVARAMQRAFLPLARLAMPEMVDYDMPEFAAARHWAAVSIRKTYPGQGRRAAHAAWGLRPMMFAKMLVMVDDDVDVRSQEAVSAAIAANFRPDHDIIMEQGPADPFDMATTAGALGQKMAIDATRKLANE